jgi:hypothetical protein
MLLNSCVSCSSAHESLSASSCACAAPESWGVLGWVSPRGVEAALAFAFFRGGIVDRVDVGRLHVEVNRGNHGRAGTAAQVQGSAYSRRAEPRTLWRHTPPQRPTPCLHRHGRCGIGTRCLLEPRAVDALDVLCGAGSARVDPLRASSARQ